jgi:hypothetical protein
MSVSRDGLLTANGHIVHHTHAASAADRTTSGTHERSDMFLRILAILGTPFVLFTSLLEPENRRGA